MAGTAGTMILKAERDDWRKIGIWNQLKAASCGRMKLATDLRSLKAGFGWLLY